MYGGFGSAPKFPAPHNLDFLLRMYETRGDEQALQMAEKTLLHMYSGGMFDHIGYGFCRYSTDRRFLVPHFEKMLYDNALLLSAYCHAFRATGNAFYRGVAERIADYLRRELLAPDGDAGVEALPFLLPPEAAVRVLPAPTKEYPLKDGKTTYYVCRGRRCLPPVNRPEDALR